MKIENNEKYSKLCCVVLAIMIALTTWSFTFNAASTDTDTTDPSVTEEPVAQQIAEEGTVLLKNDSALPLQMTDNVYAVNIDDQIYGGIGSGQVLTNLKVSYRNGLDEAVSEGKIASVRYSSAGSVSNCNKALYLITRSGSEDVDTENAAGAYQLATYERNEIQSLISAVGKENVIVVLNVASVMDTTWLLEQNVGTILLVYFGGSYSGTALKNVLTGEVNPSGKTVDTWAKSYEDYPSNSIGTFGAELNSEYTEDVYVGYRYFSTFDPDYERVNFEFGFGLSYTDFTITPESVQVKDGEVLVTAVVKNTGTVAGKEVVQLYYSAPQETEEGIYFGNPARELGAFVKTNLLEPGEQESVTLCFSLEDMATFDDLGKISANSYLLLSGEYTFYLGNSVKNAQEVGTYTQSETLVGDQLTELETMLSSRLTSDGTYEELYTPLIAAYGATTLQAEYLQDGENTGQRVGANIALGAIGFNYVTGVSAAGTSLEYTIEAEKAGYYKLGYSVAGTSSDANVADVYLDGVLQWSGLDYTDTGAEDTFRYFVSDDMLYLSEGKHTLRIESNGGMPNIDLLTFFSNSLNPEGETVIEAENFDGESSGVGCGDAACTAVAQESGITYSYTLTIEQAGKYDMTAFYSNVRKASEDAVTVSVNGAEAGTLDLKRTARSDEYSLESNYYTFTESDSIILDLPEGEVTITIETTNNSLTCLDKLIFTPYSGTPRVSGTYSNNTSDFQGRLNEEGETLSSVMTWEYLKNTPEKLDSFISQLSVDELISLTEVTQDLNNPSNSAGVGGFGGGNGTALSNFGVPNCYPADAGAGLRLQSYTGREIVQFPSATMIASTWNTDLAEKYGEEVGKQFVQFGFQMWLAPSINIHRDPLCGRNFEYYSEDPLISGKIGAAAIRGAQSTGIAVCVKHFAANNQETNRYMNNSLVSGRALREIYLKAFEIVVEEGQPLALMSSYNMLNGKYVAADETMLVDILRNEWGFDGIVISDWWAYADHVSMLKAGNNIKADNGDTDFVKSAFLSGAITRDELEENARDILKCLLRLDGVDFSYNTEMYVTVRAEDAEGNELSSEDVAITVSEENGEYVISWTANGYSVVALSIGGEEKIDLSEGETSYTLSGISEETEVVLYAEVVTQANPDPGGTTPAPADRPNIGIWIGIGAGALVIAAGIVTVVILRRRNKNK